MATRKRTISLYDTVEGSTSVAEVAPGHWELRQRFLGEKGDIYLENQCPTWVRVENTGEIKQIRVSLYWGVSNNWPAWRMFGYLKTGGSYRAVRGEADGRKTEWRFEVPPGNSWFGAFPWYDNGDAEAFIVRMGSRPDCLARVVGKSAQGREIHCLTVGREGRGRRNVVVLARMHATESSGSFAVEAVADFLTGDPDARCLLDQYCFHLFPSVNPDGVARGLKFSRWGPAEECDIELHTMTSPDETARVLREEVCRLRPSCYIDYHSYHNPTTGIFFFEDRFGLAVLRRLLLDRRGRDTGFYARWMNSGDCRSGALRHYCYRNFGTAVTLAELSWNFGLLPHEVGANGLAVFRAVMDVHRRRAAGNKNRTAASAASRR